MSKKAREEGAKEMSGEATARGAMDKSKYVMIIEEEEEVRRDDPIEYFLPARFGNTF